MHVHSLLTLGLALFPFAYAGDSRRRQTKRASGGISNALPSGWSHSGCFSDSVSNRVLNGPSYNDNTGMKQETCIQFCSAKGYNIAGVEFGSECFCGRTLSNSAARKPTTDCNRPCSGAADEVCGAADRINIFTSDAAPPSIKEYAGAYTSLGCYSDSSSGHTLTTRMPFSVVRVTDCTRACGENGFAYAGVNNGDQCYCGSQISNGAQQIDAAACNIVCQSDNLEICGGYGAIVLYKNAAVAPDVAESVPGDWPSKGCYTDSISSRALQHQIRLEKNTVGNCIAACKAAGYSYAGLEYGNECFCGNSISPSHAPASSGCDMACSGNKAETCGGAARISIYEWVPPYPSCDIKREPYTCYLNGVPKTCPAEQYCFQVPDGSVCFGELGNYRGATLISYPWAGLPGGPCIVSRDPF